MAYYFMDDKIVALCNSIMEDAEKQESSSSSEQQPSASSSTADGGLTTLDIQCPTYERNGRKFSKRKQDPEYIVIHYTAGTSSASGKAKATAEWQNRQDNAACGDFYVDRENIVQYNPDYKRFYGHSVRSNDIQGRQENGVVLSFHGKCTNSNSISIEICSDFDTNKDNGKYDHDANGKKTTPSATNPGYYMHPQTVALAAKLCGALMKEFNIGPEHVIMHNMVDGKLCPAPWSRNAEEVEKFQEFVRMASGNTSFVISKSPIPIGPETFTNENSSGSENNSNADFYDLFTVRKDPYATWSDNYIFGVKDGYTGGTQKTGVGNILGNNNLIGKVVDKIADNPIGTKIINDVKTVAGELLTNLVGRYVK